MVNIRNIFFIVLIFSFVFVTAIAISIGIVELWDDLSSILGDSPQDWQDSLTIMSIEEITLYLAFFSLVLFCLLLILREAFRYLRGNYPNILFDISDDNFVGAGDKKVVAVIPAYNEEKTLRQVIQDVRKYTDAVVVVNDGSKDATAQIAIEENGILINHVRNLGLGRTMRDGIAAALENGADIVVTIDADGQYRAEEIPALLTPITAGYADFVMGSRLKGKIEKMPRIKRWGNSQFTKLLRYLTGVGISDGQTGFRALSREAAKNADISAGYTYTQEMIIKLAAQGFRFAEIPIHFDKRSSGESRLMSSPFDYAVRALMLLLKTMRDYHPLKLFGSIGFLLLVSGVILGEYVAIGWFQTGTVEHAPTMIIAVLLLISGVQILIFGLLADAIKELKIIRSELKD